MSFPSPSPVARNGEEPPLEKKKKASSLVLPQNTISSLPDDLVLNCLARVSKLYYPALSLVSKKFRLLLASTELYKSRSLLGRTENCLYVCLRYNEDSDALWFTLCLKPNQNQTKKKKKKSSGYVLATIPTPHSRPVHWGSVVAVGSNIYAIGGSNFEGPGSSRVSILDCWSHTWHESPSMRVERNEANANVFDGKIYVAGGNDSSDWMEVFDPKTQTWETVLCPIAESCMSEVGKSAVVKGTIFMFGNCKGLAYKPKENRWVSLGGLTFMDIGWVWSSYCVIGNVLYCYSRLQRGIIWYNSKIGFWVKLLGLKGLPKFPKYSCKKLVCYGGKMVVLWDMNLPSSSGYQNKTIWCAVIALEKRKNNKEIWGNVESLDDNVLTVPSSYEFVCALNATV